MHLVHGLLVLTAIHLLAAASPGPDFLLVTQQTLTKGKRTGVFCSLGISLGLSVHILYSSLGLAALVAHSMTGLWILKLLGGTYLIYLGTKGLRAHPRGTVSLAATAQRGDVWYQAIGKGFLCNLLNPKAPIYFVSLFTITLSPTMPAYQLAIYGIWIMMLQFLWFSLVALVLSRPSVNAQFQKLGHWIDRICGGVMLLLGIKVLCTKIN